MGGKACNLNRTHRPPLFFPQKCCIRTIYFKRSSNSLVIAIGLLSPISAVCIFSLPLWEISAEWNWGRLKFQRLDVCFPSDVLSHCFLWFLMCPGRQKHIPLPAPQNGPPSPSETENGRGVGGRESC